MRTLIAGVGYSNLSDLSAGPLVAAWLQRERWPAHVEVDDLSYGPIAVVHRFAEAAPSYRRLVLIGAADRGRKAARVRCYRWEGVLPPAEEVQARVAEAVTGVIDLDNLLVVAQQFGALPEEAELALGLNRSLQQAGSYEDFLDRIRIFAQEHMFLVGTRILSGTVSAEQAGEAFARLADTLIRSLHRAIDVEFVKQQPGALVQRADIMIDGIKLLCQRADSCGN